MNILGIDPGSTLSAYVMYRADTREILERGILANDLLIDMLSVICDVGDIAVYIEMVASYGMPVGKDVFETCVIIGKIVRELEREGIPVRYIYRKDVKMTLCGSMKAKDANIRQACIDILGKEACRGIKKDMWSALAICLTAEQMMENERKLKGGNNETMA